MADFVDPVVTQEITDAKDKLVAQADRAEVIIDNWESCQPIPEAPIDGNVYGRKDAGWEVVSASGAIPDRVDTQFDAVDKDFLFMKLDTSSTLSRIPLSTGASCGLMSIQQANDLANAQNSLSYPEGRFNPAQTEIFQIKNTANNASQWLSLPNAGTSQTGFMTGADKTKLNGIEVNAQVNKFDFNDAPSDGQQYARQNGAWAVVTGGGGGAATWGSITGTLSDQTDLQAALDAKIESFNLSAVVAPTTVTINNPEGNNAIISSATTSNAGVMSNTDKTKLDGIAAGAEVNVNADWNASTGDAQILNKPTLGSLASQDDAPSDGTPYARQNGGWVAAGGAGGVGFDYSNAYQPVFVMRSGSSYSVPSNWANTIREIRPNTNVGTMPSVSLFSFTLPTTGVNAGDQIGFIFNSTRYYGATSGQTTKTTWTNMQFNNARGSGRFNLKQMWENTAKTIGDSNANQAYFQFRAINVSGAISWIPEAIG